MEDTPTPWEMTAKRTNLYLKGFGFALVALVILTANGIWLITGDVHLANGYFIMRYGWPGFIISGAVAGTSALLAALSFRRARHLKQSSNPDFIGHAR